MVSRKDKVWGKGKESLGLRVLELYAVVEKGVYTKPSQHKEAGIWGGAWRQAMWGGGLMWSTCRKEASRAAVSWVGG